MSQSLWPGQQEPQARVTVDLPYWLASLRDPSVRAAALLVGGVVAGFVAVGLSWRGVAPLLFVPLQLPFAVSGGIAGVALVGASIALLDIHAERRRAAARRALLEETVRDVAEMAELLRRRRRPTR
ncbi:MAG: hypothetical protein QOE05_3025 [Actinomycetota bacterium]|nr:hypothetical protein [Actinomycetota bacterium]